MVSIPTDPIEGTWLPIKAVLAGDPAPGLALEQMRLVIHAGTYAVHFSDQVTDAGSIALSQDGESRMLTLSSRSGVNAGRTIPSIYQLVGDRLRICYGLNGRIPGTFESTPGSEHYLVTYRRQSDIDIP